MAVTCYDPKTLIIVLEYDMFNPGILALKYSNELSSIVPLAIDWNTSYNISDSVLLR